MNQEREHALFLITGISENWEFSSTNMARQLLKEARIREVLLHSTGVKQH